MKYAVPHPDPAIAFAWPSPAFLAASLLGVALLTTAFPESATAEDLEGYAEPYRTIRVATDESGTIESVLVEEGSQVAAGQPLVRLNSDVHQALLAIAAQSMRALGRLQASEAELKLRQERLDKLQSLRREGHARQEEVDRAVTSVEVARANVRSEREDLLGKQLNFEKIKAQLARRTVRAPLAGVITHLHKRRGEFVAPNSPDVLTLVQIDKLLANFTFAGSETATLRVGQKISVRFLTSKRDTEGTIEFISPVTDAESGTVLVKIRVDNSAGHLRSGERCRIRIGK